MPKLVGFAYVEALVRNKGRHLLRVRQESASSIDVGDYQRKTDGCSEEDEDAKAVNISSQRADRLDLGKLVFGVGYTLRLL